MDQYQTYYADLHFERADFFKVNLKRYQCRDVLYPGCCIRITPSLFFPHVVYVDKSEDAARLFADEEPIVAYIKRRKHYKQSTYIRFIRQDYPEPLPLMEGTFDLMLALFAGGISRSCKNYLGRGGLLISNNHQDDAVEALKDKGLRLIGVIKFQRGQYVISEGGMDAIRILVHKSYKNSLRQANGNVEYIEHEAYYVFERNLHDNR